MNTNFKVANFLLWTFKSSLTQVENYQELPSKCKNSPHLLLKNSLILLLHKIFWLKVLSINFSFLPPIPKFINFLKTSISKYLIDESILDKQNSQVKGQPRYFLYKYVYFYIKICVINHMVKQFYQTQLFCMNYLIFLSNST